MIYLTPDLDQFNQIVIFYIKQDPENMDLNYKLNQEYKELLKLHKMSKREIKINILVDAIYNQFILEAGDHSNSFFCAEFGEELKQEITELMARLESEIEILDKNQYGQIMHIVGIVFPES